MNKLEYIPGDLVSYNGNIITIENSDGYYATYYDEDECLQEINVNAIKGIPLTPKILEKNGWQEGYGIYYYEDITIVYIDNYYWIIGLKEIPDILHINYIHQLQHLLFGLGINHEIEI